MNVSTTTHQLHKRQIYQIVKIPLKSSNCRIFVIMKQLTLLICSCLAAITMFNSCSNDFELVDNWKDIPIVERYSDCIRLIECQ